MADNMEVSSLLNVQWNNYLENLKSMVKNVFNDQSFVDVTIVCQDGLLRAHKLVLSSCSPYFEKLFQENPCKHPTIIMKEITLLEMQKLVQFIYLGFVEVRENNLHSLLNLARELQIKGLSEEAPSIDEQDISQKTSDHVSSDPDVCQVINDSTSSDEVDSRTFQATCKAESSNNNASIGHADMLRSQVLKEKHIDETKPLQSTHHPVQVDYDAVIAAQTIMNMSCSNKCPTCQSTFHNKHYLKRHMQIHSGLKPYLCNLCNKSFRRLSHLQRHQKIHTGERPFICKECQKSFSRSDKLRCHVMKRHANTAQSH